MNILFKYETHKIIAKKDHERNDSNIKIAESLFLTLSERLSEFHDKNMIVRSQTARHSFKLEIKVISAENSNLKTKFGGGEIR